MADNKSKTTSWDALAEFLTEVTGILADGKVTERKVRYDETRNRVEVISTYTSGRTEVRYFVPEK